MKSVVLPRSIDDSRLDYIFKILQLIKFEKVLNFDFGKTENISPAGYAILACLFDSVVEQKCKLKFKKINKKIKNNPIISKFLEINTFSKLPAPSHFNIEEKDFCISGNLLHINPLFISNFLEKFKINLHSDLAFEINVVMNELMQNCVDHSGAERYYMYAGLSNNEFHVGVLDMGVSIPDKLQQKYKCNNDLEYLELAVQQGISTRRIREGGFGLYYFWQILKQNSAKLTIISKSAQIRLYFKTRKSQKTLLKAHLDGTWCFARFPIINSFKNHFEVKKNV